MDSIISIFQGFFTSILNFLPGSPFKGFINSVSNIPYLAELNWFVPVAEIIGIMEIWLIAVALIFTYRAILKYINLL